MSWITTSTGLHLDPLHPDVQLIRLDDIAHALSRICRGGGHVRGFYSVAQHCIACEKEAEARGLSVRVRLACLLHDAAEAYLLDIPRPLKAQMPQYAEAEKGLLRVILSLYFEPPLSEEERSAVKDIDDDMMSWEFHCQMPEESSDRWKKLAVLPDCVFRPFDETESEYMRLADALSADCRPAAARSGGRS